MLPVTEIFKAMQAEGSGGAHSLYGSPVIFYRLFGCSLSCFGFKVPIMRDGVHLKDNNGKLMYGCDSYSSVEKSFKDTAKMYTADEMIEKYYKLSPKGSYKNAKKVGIIISGGEPSLHQKNEEFQKFVSFFISRGIPVMMETNGTVPIDFTLNPHMKKVMFSISPKLSSAGDSQHRRIKLDVLEGILKNADNAYLKFVVSEDNFYPSENNELSEWEEIKMILNGLHTYVENVMLMGMGGVNDETFRRNEKFAYETALDLRFCFSPRTHINLFSDERFR